MVNNKDDLSWAHPKLKAMLVKECQAMGIELSLEQVNCFLDYGRVLSAENERFNLSAITNPEEIIRKHFVDSLAALPYLPRETTGLADVGSGAGLPGLALKIMRPKMKLTLIESVNKKATFLKQTVAKLALSDVIICPRRAEEVGQDPLFREQFPVATARAVAALAVLLELVLPLVAVGGQFFAYKGPGVAAELAAAQRALKELGGEVTDVKEFSLAGKEQRTLVVVTKVAPTPAKYPRSPGRPAKRPL
ncbi:MAG: 16S rRNA (guanine(527)-N(7))-methyltransferase RsmG [Firmicutes bacterium]|jgi:16S rRNA (guanine527-N7)-methyltransferase|nr:16S rRNA (guanine(527)-N(7))-methyltransferase RsmG [Bacillota bacterium]